MIPNRALPWTLLVMLAVAPLIGTLCWILWHTPFPLTEAVAIFEDAVNRPWMQFLTPDTSYYRPLYYLTISGIWQSTRSIDSRLQVIALVQMVAVVVLVAVSIWHWRPRRALEAAAALVAVAVLCGSPGFQDNLELPLSYTTVGMPLALIAWMLANGSPRRWHLPALLLLTVVAIGFKEQGLVIVPVVLVAWWMGAAGVSRAAAVSVAALAIGYVALRLAWPRSGPMFEQAIGFGFSEMEPPEAFQRFGSFPFGIYAYNGASTMLNVLFSEPTRGIFRNLHALIEGRWDVWQLVQSGSSAIMTGLIAWWGMGLVRHRSDPEQAYERRLAVALLVALLSCGVLSFNYSRSRLGGMALVFYALAAFHALRYAIARVRSSPRSRRLLPACGLALLGLVWSARTLTTLEYLRYTATLNQRQWVTLLPVRRIEFAERFTYVRIMESMVPQGRRRSAPRQTPYPRWVERTLGLPTPPPPIERD
jgi:hypothetical protein